MQLYCFLKRNLLNSNSNSASIFILCYIKVDLRCDLLPIVPFPLASNFTKSNTPPWMFSHFLNCVNGTKSCNASHLDIPWVSHGYKMKIQNLHVTESIRNSLVMVWGNVTLSAPYVLLFLTWESNMRIIKHKNKLKVLFILGSQSHH